METAFPADILNADAPDEEVPILMDPVVADLIVVSPDVVSEKYAVLPASAFIITGLDAVPTELYTESPPELSAAIVVFAVPVSVSGAVNDDAPPPLSNTLFAVPAIPVFVI